MSRSNDIANITASVLDGVTAAEVGLGNVTNESKDTMFTSPTFTGDVSATNIKHASSSSNNLVLGSDGNVSITNTLSAGTIGSSVTFPTRSDFGIIETISAGDPLIGASSSQDFSYTSGQEYCVMLDIWFTDSSYSRSEVYRINTDNTVTQVAQSTGNVTPSIPSSGTLRITTATVRNVSYVIIIRMDW